MPVERVLRWSLVIVAIVGLAVGIVAHLAGRSGLADFFWMLATVPVIAGLAVSIGRDLLAGRLGVDAIALLSMTAALVLGQPLAGAVIALMYSGGNVLEVIAVSRAERNLRSLVDRAPRVAHRRVDDRTVDVPVAEIAIGDGLLVRTGEVIPVDGIIDADAATIDESALTGEPIPATKSKGAAIYSGSLNAGQTFEMKASAVAGESTYAGILRLVAAAQTAKSPFVRLADRRTRVPAVHGRSRLRRMAHFKRSNSQPRRTRGGDAVSAHPGCPGCLHRRRRARRSPRHPGQGRRPARSAGACPYGFVR